jgi:aryl-alcohol dehydrogenase-like predicted oxidoreductase
METRTLGSLWPVSELALGGGGVAQVWGETSRDEGVATVRAAADAGITLYDAAPIYGRGEAEMVFGEAFDGAPPAGSRFTTKCYLGSPPAEEVYPRMEKSLLRSLETMKIERADLFFLHSNICPDDYVYSKGAEMQHRFATTWSLYEGEVIPAFEKLKEKGLIADWGITGAGLPKSIMDALRAERRPAAVQAVTNLMDSAGSMFRFEEPPEPRNIIRTAQNNDVGVLGIRAVQAGALTDALDREAAPEEQADFLKAAPFRALAADLGEDTAVLAHRYALAMPGVDCVILGVKNRAELKAILAGVTQGPLPSEVISQIEALRLNFQIPRMPID